MIESIHSGPGGTQFRVRRHRPVRNAVLVAVAVIGLGVGGWSLYRAGVEAGGHDARAARATEAHLRGNVSDLRERVAELGRRNTLLQRGQRVDEDALRRLRDTLAEQKQRIARLEEELAFYRNLVSPSEMQPGLHVRRMSLGDVPGAAREYRYELVLTQLNSDDTYVAGRVDFRVEGRVPDGPTTLAFEQITAGDGEDRPAFRFKYFQTLRGRIRLPAAFEPLTVRVRARPSGGRLEPVERTYPWKSLLAGGT